MDSSVMKDQRVFVKLKRDKNAGDLNKKLIFKIWKRNAAIRFLSNEIRIWQNREHVTPKNVM